MTSDREEIKNLLTNRVKAMYEKAEIPFGFYKGKEFNEFNADFLTNENEYCLFVHYPDSVILKGSKSKELIAEHRAALSIAGFNEFITFRENVFKFVLTYRQIIDGIFEGQHRSQSETVADKIQKLLALSQSSNQHEAELAAMKAQELIAQFGYEGKDEGIIVHIQRFDFLKYPKLEWELLGRIAESYRCKTIGQFYGKDLAYLNLFGTKTDLQVFSSVANYLVVFAWKKARYMQKPTDYYKGFIAGVSEVLRQQCVALQLVVPAEVDSKIKETCTNLGTSKAINIYDSYGSSSFNMGEKDGKKAMESRQIEGE